MGWYNDNLAQYNTKVTPGTNSFFGQTPTVTTPGKNAKNLNYKENQYSAPDNQHALSYSVNLDGKDYYYSPLSTKVGAGAAYSWDQNKAKDLGGVEWNRALPGAFANPNNSNYFSQALPETYEKGYLFENDPNPLKNSQYNEWNSSSFWKDQGLGLAAIAAAPFAVSAGLGAIGANTAAASAAPISGTGAASLSAPTTGGALTAPAINVAGTSGATTGTGFLGGSIPAYTPAMDAAGMGAGGYSSIANGAGSTLGAAGGGSSMLSGLGDMFGNLSGGQKLGLGMGLTDMAMRYNQQQELKDIAEKSSRMANPLNDPQRQQYQQLLSQYLNGGMDITQQPIVKSEMDAMKRAAEAQMAKAGMTGSGNAGNIMSDYMLEAMNRTSQPYLNFLAGAGGFNGQGNGANIYATMAGQATGAPFQGMNSLGSALNNLTYNQPPWWSSAYNAQQQMMGRGNNSNFYGIA
jgi:hypothetical protein